MLWAVRGIVAGDHHDAHSRRSDTPLTAPGTVGRSGILESQQADDLEAKDRGAILR